MVKFLLCILVTIVTVQLALSSTLSRSVRNRDSNVHPTNPCGVCPRDTVRQDSPLPPYCGLCVPVTTTSCPKDRPITPNGPACQPLPDESRPQYIIGYGSLMQEASKNKTDPNTAPNIPVQIRGFSREWSIRGTSPTYSTTFLGILKIPNSSFNGVIYRLTPKSQPNYQILSNYDRRERYYCRQSVNPSQITSLDPGNSEIDQSAQYWVYVNKPEHTCSPDTEYPIVESYVDIFLSGCLELETKFQLDKFTEKCIETTKGWNSHWVNDRILPRRPFVYEKMAGHIDTLLKSKLPSLFASIKIE